MKKIIITRHAKSDWSNLYQTDFERTLNERGLRDAPMMGKRLQERNLNIEKIISSTAKRATQTALLIAKEINYDLTKIKFEENLYHAPALVIKDVIYEIPNEINTAMIVCHNDGITDFVNSIVGFVTSNVPTCGMTAFTFECEKWEQISNSKATLLFYDFPKNLVV